MAVRETHALGTEALRVLAFVTGYQSPGRGDYAPPRKITITASQETSNGSRRTGMAGLLSNFAVCQNGPERDVREHATNVVLKIHHNNLAYLHLSTG